MINCEPIYNKKFLKTKTRSYSDEAREFHDKEIPKAGSNYTCLVVTLLDSVLKKDENYYLQAFLKECKYVEKEKVSEYFIKKANLNVQNKPFIFQTVG